MGIIMSIARAQKTQYSDGVAGMLPIFYVAWADAVLSPSEMEYIHERIRGMVFLEGSEKELLLEWVDPANPPADDVFDSWLQEMRARGSALGKGQRRSLAELGIEMARRGAHSTGIAESPKVYQALRDLEKAFRLESADRTDALLAHLFHEEKPVPQSQVNAQALRDILDEPYPGLRNRVRRLFQDPVFRMEHIPDKTAYRVRVLGWLKTLSQYGYGAYAFPEEYGGRGDVGRHMAVFEMLGYHDLSLGIKFGVQFGLFGGAVYGLGTERHHRQYLKAIGQGELLGCFAMTETAHGSNVKGLETTATHDADSGQLVVHTPHREAGKEYIGNALHGELAVVFAQLVTGGKQRGVHAVLVPLRDGSGELLPGVTVEDNGYKMGLNGVDNGRIWFDEVRVPVDNLLDRFGRILPDGTYQSEIEHDGKRFFTMLSTLVAGRISVALAACSATKVGLTVAVRYGLKRRQFGPKEGAPETILMDYPSHQERLLPLIARTYAYHFALQDLAGRFSGEFDGADQEIESLAAGLKALATRHATEAIQECREACGGKGYLVENRFAALKADTDIFTTFEGDNTVLLQLVAKGLLSDFKKQFNDVGFFGIMRLLAGRWGTTLTELNPYIIRKTDTDHLSAGDFHENAMRYREQRLLYSVAQRMRKLLGQKMSAYDAFLRCQTHLIVLAEAHLERVVLGIFKQKWEDLGQDHEASAVLERVYQLYALDTIWQHRGWYLENDYISGSKSKAIRRLRDKLLRDLRPEAGALVAAFGIPAESLAAEILGD
jgi:acyl-CoA oxidase